MSELSFEAARDAAERLTLDSVVKSIPPKVLRRSLRIRAVENS